MAKIKNIIFDLGGVIINLNIPKTISEFNSLSNQAFEDLYTQAQQTHLFDLFDKGLISEHDFFNQLNISLKTKASTEQLLYAWNAMLLDFPEHRLNMLLALKTKYRIFLLSNTNETHIKALEQILKNEHGYTNLDSFFEKTYYSCRIGMRKPNTDIFEFVLNENNLNPTETIFIDDSIQHVNGAKQANINSYLLEKDKDVTLLLQELKLI